MTYSHLTLQERYVIYYLVRYGLSYREIGRRLNWHYTTISREVKRNGPTYSGGVYWHKAAKHCANQRKYKARHCLRRSNSQLVSYVQSKIRAATWETVNPFDRSVFTSFANDGIFGKWSDKVLCGTLNLSIIEDVEML